MRMHKATLPAASRERLESQIEFVREYRDTVPKLASRAVKKAGCSLSSVYGVLNDTAFHPAAIVALYEVVTEHLGISDPVGERIDSRGRTVANEYDRAILEDFTSAQEHERLASDLRTIFTQSLRKYEEAYLLAEIQRSALLTRYRLTGRALSPETLTIIAEYVATPVEDRDVYPSVVIDIPYRSREQVLHDRAMRPSSESSSVAPAYEPLPPYVPEPGNTDADYLEFLRTSDPDAYDLALKHRASLAAARENGMVETRSETNESSSLAAVEQRTAEARREIDVESSR